MNDVVRFLEAMHDELLGGGHRCWIDQRQRIDVLAEELIGVATAKASLRKLLQIVEVYRFWPPTLVNHGLKACIRHQVAFHLLGQWAVFKTACNCEHAVQVRMFQKFCQTGYKF